MRILSRLNASAWIGGAAVIRFGKHFRPRVMQRVQRYHATVNLTAHELRRIAHSYGAAPRGCARQSVVARKFDCEFYSLCSVVDHHMLERS